MKEKMIAYKQVAGKTMKAILTVVKVIFYEAVIILIACGVLYMTNWHIEWVRTIKTISPISTEVSHE